MIIGGDFESDPSAYKAVQDAIATGTWHDPLIEYDQEGNPVDHRLSDLPLRTHLLGLLVLMDSWSTP